MSAAGVAVDWFGDRRLLNLYVIPVVLEASRLGVDWIVGCLLVHWGEGPWPRCLQVFVRWCGLVDDSLDLALMRL